MKKQTSSGASKILILFGMVFVALLALAVLWAPRFIRRQAPVARPPAAQHIKITQVPPAPSPPAPPVEPAQPPQQASAASAPEISSAGEQPSQESVQPQAAEPAGSGASEAVTKEAETPEAAPAKKTSEEPAVVATAHDESTQTQPEENTPSAAADDAQAEPEVARPAEAPNAGTAYFSLQVGAFRQKAYAVDTMGKLSKKGFNAFIYEVTDSRQRIWYTVRIGHYNSSKEAASALDQFKQQEKIDAIVTKAVKP